jgi:hypothetical protein
MARWVVALGALALAPACGAPQRGGEAQDPLPPAPRPGAAAAASAFSPAAAAASSASSGRGTPSRRRQLKGQLHAHSDRSYDARTPPERVLRFYQERGYDFVSLTDHNRVTVVDAPPGLLLVPGVELTQNATDCDPPPSPGFRCLFHSAALFVDPSRDAARGGKLALPFQRERAAAYSSQLAVTRELGGVAVLNHPLFHFAADARRVARLAREGVALVELINASLDRQHPDGEGAARQRAERLWDEALELGARVFALATDDAHHFDDVAARHARGKFAYEGDKAWVMVDAEPELAAVREALLAGRFYASTGPSLSDWRVEAGLIEGTVAGEQRHVVRCKGRGGRVLDERPGPAITCRAAPGEPWVRAVVQRDDGAVLWLQPSFLDPPRVELR